MLRIKPQLTKELLAHVGDHEVWQAPAFKVRNYRELVEHAAKLSYANKSQLAFFRGQGIDYQSKAQGSTLYPAIYRGDNLAIAELELKLRTLDTAAQQLSRLFEEHAIEGWRDIKRKKLVQWSILQHYEVVPTPLIDITHSIRVACSFAQLASHDDKCYVYALGFPYPTNRISINSEEEIVNIRLLSICPPQALRPHFQEGYMAGTPDVTSNYESKTELDLRNRLIAKFEIPSNDSFWSSGVEIMPREALYPEDDQVKELCKRITLQSSLSQLGIGDIGQFVIKWAKLEEQITARARQITQRNLSIREAIKTLESNGLLSAADAQKLDEIRRTRNLVAHTPERAKESEVLSSLEVLDTLSKTVQRNLAGSQVP
jgi:uncharacterized protein YutE (UPF0331/DUF86 family)